MRLKLGAILISAVLALSFGAPASARNYDCTKAGNANKAACKAHVGQSVAVSKTTKAVVTSSATTSPAASSRHYDCSKAGNRNKAACKTSAGAASPAATTVQTRTTTAGIDCTKFYNRMRAACRGPGVTTTKTTSTVAPAPTHGTKPAIAETRTTVTQNTNAAGPGGATAKCRDGSLSHSAHRSGSCSRHGGVAQWY